MAENKTRDITEMSPDSLLNTFTKKSLTQFMLIAIVIHVIVIGVTSLGTFKTWAMGAPEETEAVEENPAEPTPAETAQTASPKPPATNGGDPNANANANAGGEQNGEGESAPEGNAYVEQLRETIPPDQAPQDSDLGISIDDTSF